MQTHDKQTYKHTIYVLCLLVVFSLFFYNSLHAQSICGNNQQAKRLAELIRQHPKQSRIKINCNQQLTEIAEQKALLLSEHSVLMHNIGRLTPNQNLRHKGYPLSKNYPIIGNQVEALAAGEKRPENAFEQLLNSKPHRLLLLGNDNFYQAQNELGVAYVRQTKSPYDHYWVIYLADQHNPRNPNYEVTVNTEFSHTKNHKKMSIRERHHQSRVQKIIKPQ